MKTYKELMKLFEANQIPEDTRIMSYTGWECDATEINGAVWNPEAGIVILFQETAPDGWKEIVEKVRKGGWRQL